MDDFVEPIPKADQILDPDVFSQLLRLCIPRPWLCRKDRAAAATLNECDTPEQRDIILHLLEVFSYFDSETVNQLLESDLPMVETAWELTAENTLFTTLSRDDRLSSGELFLSLLRNKLESATWASTNFVKNLGVVPDLVLPGTHKIVVCDDFSGTGRTVEKKTLWLRNKLTEIDRADIHIYYLGLASMESAVPIIDSVVDGRHVCEELVRGISDHFEEPEKTEYLSAMKVLEQKLKQSSGFSAYSLGFGQSESVYSLADSNSPNNVFPIFWWRDAADGTLRQSMFKRIPKK